MLSNADIYRAAHLLIEQYGVDAEVLAARRADEWPEQDITGRAMWRFISQAIANLLALPSKVAH